MPPPHGWPGPVQVLVKISSDKGLQEWRAEMGAPFSLTPHSTCGLVEEFWVIKSGSRLAGDLRLMGARGDPIIFPRVAFLERIKSGSRLTGDFPRVHGLFEERERTGMGQCSAGRYWSNTRFRLF
jgi:hypothetical protein